MRALEPHGLVVHPMLAVEYSIIVYGCAPIFVGQQFHLFMCSYIM